MILQLVLREMHRLHLSASKVTLEEYIGHKISMGEIDECVPQVVRALITREDGSATSQWTYPRYDDYVEFVEGCTFCPDPATLSMRLVNPGGGN